MTVSQLPGLEHLIGTRSLAGRPATACITVRGQMLLGHDPAAVIGGTWPQASRYLRIHMLERTFSSPRHSCLP